MSYAIGAIVENLIRQSQPRVNEPSNQNSQLTLPIPSAPPSASVHIKVNDLDEMIVSVTATPGSSLAVESAMQSKHNCRSVIKINESDQSSVSFDIPSNIFLSEPNAANGVVKWSAFYRRKNAKIVIQATGEFSAVTLDWDSIPDIKSYISEDPKSHVITVNVPPELANRVIIVASNVKVKHPSSNQWILSYSEDIDMSYIIMMVVLFLVLLVIIAIGIKKRKVILKFFKRTR